MNLSHWSFSEMNRISHEECQEILKNHYGEFLSNEVMFSTSFNFAVLGDTKERVKDFAKYHFETSTDFVFDNKTRLIFVGVNRHVYLMSSLYRANKFKHASVIPESDLVYDEADSYILQGMGFFRSKSSWLIYNDGSEPPEGFENIEGLFTKL